LSPSSVVVSLPADHDVQDYQGDDWEQDVEDGVHPQDIYIEVPVVDPYVSGNELKIPKLTLSQELVKLRKTFQ
jgi:hypothetical protein